MEKMQELESLRQQVAEFKSRLEKQEIVSEQMLRESMKSRIQWIHNMNTVFYPFYPLFIIALFYIYLKNLMPLGIFLSISIVMVAELIYNILSTRPIRSGLFGTGNLIAVKRELLAFKRREKIQMAVELPIIALIIVFWVYGLRHQLSAIVWILMPLAIIVPCYTFFRELKSVDNVIRQIDDFRRSDVES